MTNEVSKIIYSTKELNNQLCHVFFMPYSLHYFIKMYFFGGKKWLKWRVQFQFHTLDTSKKKKSSLGLPNMASSFLWQYHCKKSSLHTVWHLHKKCLNRDNTSKHINYIQKKRQVLSLITQTNVKGCNSLMHFSKVVILHSMYLCIFCVVAIWVALQFLSSSYKRNKCSTSNPITNCWLWNGCHFFYKNAHCLHHRHGTR